MSYVILIYTSNFIETTACRFTVSGHRVRDESRYRPKSFSTSVPVHPACGVRSTCRTKRGMTRVFGLCDYVVVILLSIECVPGHTICASDADRLAPGVVRGNIHNNCVGRSADDRKSTCGVGDRVGNDAARSPYGTASRITIWCD